MPSNPDAVKAELLFNSPLVHSSVMLRRQDFLKACLRYAPSVARAQDYDLWERAAQKLKMANLPKVLQRYRIHSGQVGQRYGASQAQTAAMVRARQLKQLKLGASKRELNLHNEISTWQFSTNTAYLRRVETWLSAIVRANQQSLQYEPTALKVALERRWWAACRAAARQNHEAWELYRSSPLVQGVQRSLIDKATLFAKAQWPR